MLKLPVKKGQNRSDGPGSAKIGNWGLARERQQTNTGPSNATHYGFYAE
jgi:hypothetical protein